MLASITRTVVPLLVSYLVGWLASLGIDITSDVQAQITAAIGTAVAALYYVVVRWAERRWPVLSVLLGSGKQPASYTPDGAPDVGTAVVTPADPDQPAAGTPPPAA